MPVDDDDARPDDVSPDDAVTVDFVDSPLRTTRAFTRFFRATPAFVVPADVDDRARVVAARAWEDRARAEYVGVMGMRRFHGLLVDVGAPMDVQELALRMLHDEQQHASACAAAARALGSTGTIDARLVDLQQPRTAAPVDDQLLEMIVCTFAVGEVAALALLSHALKSLPASPFKDVLIDVARDEVLHASIGPALLRVLRDPATAFVPWPGDDVVRAVATKYRAWMKTRDVIEPDEAALFADPACARDLPRLGVPDARAFKAAYDAALDGEVVRVFAEAGLPWGDARV